MENGKSRYFIDARGVGVLIRHMDKIGFALLLHEKEHVPPPGHPENVDRLRAAVEELESPEFADMMTPLAISACESDPLERVHDKRLLADLRAISASGGGAIDGDTYVTGGSWNAALEVVGTLLGAVDAAFDDGPTVSFILGRPPGHHATRNQSMGFCLINNIAIAAQYAIDKGLARRVAIVDFDVHHGNGTQDIFFDRDDAFFVSTHQYPFYPGSGARSETGTGRGEGYTLNFPLVAGTQDDEILQIFEEDIIPAVTSFDPDLILVSAGFDAHKLDPLGGLGFTGIAYNQFGRMLRHLADAKCEARLISVLEGGYSAEGNRDAITNYIRGIARP